ncbi:MAG TPA: enoyl-CoA hydratase-related protein [Acidimicrobiales bacterium]|jgi:2-(1,2-epoxy-1,2-dihydrophenyl)acetyl-CoA isomerase|nr:enoyl-CoA hydratase-related protein [Acidimicrobiales bacterium]
METLIVERSGGVVTVTMNRPERKNAVNPVMLAELRQIFAEVESNSADRAMVLTGAGGAFCTGSDLGDPNGPGSDPNSSALGRMRKLGEVALALHRITKPTIAKVEGFAVGAGMSLALGCDLVVCSETAKLSMIFSKRGLSIDNGASWLLPRLVGMAKAKEIALFGGMWTAPEALELGLINRVLPASEVDAFVADWAATLAAGPPLALSLTKTLLHASAQASMEQAVEDEARCQALNFSTQDTHEAMAAFAEKRQPTFIGR